MCMLGRVSTSEQSSKQNHGVIHEFEYVVVLITSWRVERLRRNMLAWLSFFLLKLYYWIEKRKGRREGLIGFSVV